MIIRIKIISPSQYIYYAHHPNPKNPVLPNLPTTLPTVVFFFRSGIFGTDTGKEDNIGKPAIQSFCPDEDSTDAPHNDRAQNLRVQLIRWNEQQYPPAHNYLLT